MSPSPRRCAVLGSPVGHSLSPVLHQAAYAVLGLRDWEYTAVEVDEAGLAGFLDGLGPEWAGLSLTMPLKRAVIPLLDAVDPDAEAVGAVNTVVLRRTGRSGSNTDVPGMVAALAEVGLTQLGAAGPGGDTAAPGDAAAAAAGSAPVVLGGGATAASAVAALARLGAATVRLVARRPEAVGDVVAVGARLGTDVQVSGWETAAERVESTPPGSVVVSTVPAGAADDLAAQLRPGVDRPVLFDVVYAPWPTALARAWGDSPVVGGLDLLVHQAALQVPLITGAAVEPAELVPVMRAAGLRALEARAGSGED